MKRFIESKFKIIDTKLPLKTIGDHSGGVLLLPEEDHFIGQLPNTKGDLRDVLIIGANLATRYKTSNFCTFTVYIKNIIFKQISKKGKILDKNIFFVRTQNYHRNYSYSSSRNLFGGIPYSHDTPCMTYRIEKHMTDKTMMAVWIDAFKERIAFHAASEFGKSIYYGNNSFSDDIMNTLYKNPYWELHYGNISKECVLQEYESQKYHKAYKYYGPLEIDTTPDKPQTEEEREIARSYCAIMAGVNMLRLKDLLSMSSEHITKKHVREYYIIDRLQRYQAEIGIDYFGH